MREREPFVRAKGAADMCAHSWMRPLSLPVDKEISFPFSNIASCGGRTPLTFQNATEKLPPTPQICFRSSNL